MAGISLQQAESARDAALLALTAALKVKETQVTGTNGGRRTVYQDIDKLQAAFDHWDNYCKRLGRCGITTFLAVPLG